MASIKISDNIFWVGAIDWNLRSFHGHTYETRRGTTYNAYLILDEKITLVDTVYGPFSGEMIEKTKEIVPPEKIDYIVVNHVEPDHSGALPGILKLCPKAKLFGTAKCREGLYKHYYGDWDFQTVKTGDELKLGKNTLKFIEAAMIHWPDSMFSYLVEKGILLSNDAFGQHYATSERFDDEVEKNILMEEASKYYANILWPFSPLVLKKIEEIQKMKMPLNIIAPSHGIIWRKDTSRIINSYLSWAKNDTVSKVVVCYETMYGSTEKMARNIADGIISLAVPVRVFNAANTSRTEIINEMLDSRGFIVGSSTHDNDMLPNISAFMEFLKGLKPKNRIACAFGSYGWSGGAVKSLEAVLKNAGIEIAIAGVSVKYCPDENELKMCFQLGVDFAKKLQGQENNPKGGLTG